MPIYIAQFVIKDKYNNPTTINCVNHEVRGIETLISHTGFLENPDITSIHRKKGKGSHEYLILQADSWEISLHYYSSFE